MWIGEDEKRFEKDELKVPAFGSVDIEEDEELMLKRNGESGRRCAIAPGSFDGAASKHNYAANANNSASSGKSVRFPSSCETREAPEP